MNPRQCPGEPSDPDAALLELIGRYQEALQAGRGGDADSISWEVLALVGQRAAERPSPELLLQMEADRCETEADWRGAEAAYRRALEGALAAGEPFPQGRAYSDLSWLHWLLEDDEAALEEARAATAAARRAESPLLLATALEQDAACALRCRRVGEALAAIDEGLRALGDERMYDLQRGRSLVLRAECALRSGDGSGADADLEAAWPLLEAQSVMQLAAGAHSGLAKWWSVRARRQAERGDLDGAREASARAVVCRRHVALLPQVMGPYTQNALAEALSAYGQALAAAGQPEEAARAFEESRAIREALRLPPLPSEGDPG